MSEYKKRKYDNDNDYYEERYKKISDFMSETKITKKDSSKDKIENEHLKNELFCVVSELEDKLDEYLDYDEILKQFIQSVIDNTQGVKNRCTECKVDMGMSNPRQLCGKTYCASAYED